MRGLMRRVVVAAGVVVVLLGPVVGVASSVSAAGAAAGAVPAAGAVTGIRAPLPANAGADPNVFLASVSCASAGNCTAVGNYVDSSGNRQGLLLTQTAGSWATGAEAPLPANVGTAPSVNVTSVSCASAGNCTAVGDYVDSSGNFQGLLLTQTAGSWATGVEAALPPGAATDPDAAMTSVSCASAGNCTAVGRYYDPSVFAHGVLLTQTAGSWATGVEAALPAGGTSIPDSGVASVSCASAGNCTAVGPYYDSSGTTHGLLLTQTAGSWATGVEAALPAGASATDPEAGAGSVSCTSAGNCTASGGYYDSSGSSQGMLLNQTWGSWAMGLKVPLPAGARPIPDAAMTGVSCASAANCTAVGVYYDSSGAQGLLVTQTAPPTDHQLCYLAAAAGPGITLPPPGSVTLKDQFGTFKPTLSRAGQHCNPVKKIMPGGHVSPITNPSAHLLCWKITTGTTKQPPVTVSNQFGAATLSLGNASQLCLPTWKSLTAPPHKTPSQPPGLSHYTCYPVQQVTSGGYKAAQPKLQDEFAAHPVQVSVTFKPAQLCVPTTKTVVTKTGTKVYNIVTGAAELLCFPVSQTPRKTPVYDQDQFTGPGVPMTIERTLTLCLPST